MQNLGDLQVLWLLILRSPSTSLLLGLECLVTTLVVRFLGDVVDEAAVHAVVLLAQKGGWAFQKATACPAISKRDRSVGNAREKLWQFSGGD